jgi:hypothetical protein
MTNFSFTKNLRNFCLLICLLISYHVGGQTLSEASSNVAPSADSLTSWIASARIPSKNISVGLNLGVSNGIGLDLAYRFSGHWAAKVAYNYANFTKNDYTYNIVSTSASGVVDVKTLSFDVAARFSNLAFNLEYSPSVAGRFKFISGFSYFFHNTVAVGAQAISIIRVNDVQLTSDDIGSGNVEVGFNSKVSPFVGLGFGRTFPRKRMSVNFDLGTYYKTNYKVAIRVREGIFLAKNEENAAILTRNFNDKWYGKFWPLINFRLAYKLK